MVQQHQLIRFPVGPDTWIEVEWPGLVSDAEWDRIMTILDLMKPGIVRPAREGE